MERVQEGPLKLGHRTVELKDDFYLNNDLNSQMNIKIMQ